MTALFEDYLDNYAVENIHEYVATTRDELSKYLLERNLVDNRNQEDHVSFVQRLSLLPADAKLVVGLALNPPVELDVAVASLNCCVSRRRLSKRLLCNYLHNNLGWPLRYVWKIFEIIKSAVSDDPNYDIMVKNAFREYLNHPFLTPEGGSSMGSKKLSPDMSLAKWRQVAKDLEVKSKNMELDELKEKVLDTIEEKWKAKKELEDKKEEDDMIIQEFKDEMINKG